MWRIMVERRGKWWNVTEVQTRLSEGAGKFCNGMKSVAV